MSTGEFRRYIAKHDFSKIIFNSEDQAECMQYPSVFFRLEFNNIQVSLCPDVISLSGTSGVLCFNNLLKIEKDKPCVLGTVFHLTSKNNTGFSHYNLIFCLS